MNLLLILLLVCLLINLVYCACGPPYVFPGIYTFGPNCRYRCNCLNNEQCNPQTGECPNGCSPGWMDPACQYRNLAAAANPARCEQYPARLDFPPTYAVDGDASTCSRTSDTGSGQRYLRIDLGSMVYIVGLVIRIPRSDVNIFRGFTVDIGNTTLTFRPCFVDGPRNQIKETMEVACFEPQIGQHIWIRMVKENVERLSVCELGIYGGRIISFNQQTEMDSIYQGLYNGAYAVDGEVHKTEISFSNPETRTCAVTDVDYTRRRNRWWGVDLLHIYSIQAVSFFARQDSDMQVYQYSGYVITVSADKNTFIQFAGDSPTNDRTDYSPKSHNLTWPRDGRFLRVSRNNAEILTICEFEIFAECAYGSCGWSCDETCMCTSQTAGTHKIIGTCPHGCAGRWTGLDGKCNIECQDNRWGTTCEHECGYCTHPCNVVNGTCPESCYPGWEPPYCKKACAEGKYGTDCSMVCGNCATGTSCDLINGRCDDGCKPGYKLPNCHDVCDVSSYGQNCLLTCGSCRYNDTCHHINGTCPNRCEPGFQGHSCHEVCTKMSFGLDCKHECGRCRNDVTCNRVSGHCHAGCAPGWKTPFCNQSCDIGTFGHQCSERCGHCLNGEACHHETGTCPNGCTAGYMGRDCKTTCPDGRFGENCFGTCGACVIITSYCHKQTGECSNGCLPGWLGRNCTLPCTDGFYGHSCYLRCGHCKDGHPCDPQTGHCQLCEAGYTGEFCKSICTAGRYGEGCQHTCGSCAGNEPCNRSTGACPHGCSERFTGSLCKQGPVCYTPPEATMSDYSSSNSEILAYLKRIEARLTHVEEKLDKLDLKTKNVFP